MEGPMEEGRGGGRISDANIVEGTEDGIKK